MEFTPNNPIVQLCIQGMVMEDNGNPEDALALFTKAWTEASNHMEKFLSAYYVARQQNKVSERLKWLENALQFALKLDNDAVKAAFPAIYSKIALCYDELGNHDDARKNRELSVSSQCQPTDKGPFYHGTKANLQIGDLLIPGGMSNYQSELKMNHIYFTALINIAALAADLAQGSDSGRVYIVEPTGSFDHDPNVTDKKFPGNLTRSYRSLEPLKIVGEVKDWSKLTPDQLKKWNERVEENKDKIIN